MRKLSGLLIGMVLGGALMYVSLQYHVVRTNDGFVWVPKRTVTLSDTYVDVRKWGLTEWSQHQDLMWSLVQNGKANVLGDAGTLENTLRGALELRK